MLAPRDGIAATRLRAPGGRQMHPEAGDPVPATIRDWLETVVIPRATAAEEIFHDGSLAIDYFVGDGMLTGEHGARVGLDDPLEPGGFYFFHKPYPPEPRVPFEIDVLHEDRDLLIVDKPHFLSSTPNGRFVRECVVTRLRADRGEDDLVAIHRLDRVTAGVLVLSRRPATRGAYQMLFQDRRIRKIYRAVAWLPSGWRPGDPLPLGLTAGGEPREIRNRLHKISGERPVRIVDGEPNALTSIRLLSLITGRRRPRGVLALEPHTGKTHQLRVHLNSIGMPIVGDPVYPTDLGPESDDFSSPLQLLAQRLEFHDPLTGEPRAFESRRSLSTA